MLFIYKYVYVNTTDELVQDQVKSSSTLTDQTSSQQNHTLVSTTLPASNIDDDLFNAAVS